MSGDSLSATGLVDTVHKDAAAIEVERPTARRTDGRGYREMIADTLTEYAQAVVGGDGLARRTFVSEGSPIEAMMCILG